MELDELKASWNILGERLQQNEILNKRIIREMITNRVLSAHQGLLRKNIKGYILYFLCLIFIWYMQLRWNANLVDVLCVTGLLVFGALTGVPGFIKLYKFEVNDPVRLSFQRILYYKRSMKVLFPVMIVLALSLMCFIVFRKSDFMEHGLNRLIFISAFLIATVGSLVEYRWDKARVDAISKGLEELKEFEEEPEPKSPK